MTLFCGVAFPLGCSSDPKVGDGSGDVCNEDKDCGEGEYCRDKVCVTSCDSCGIDCESTDECPEGQFCTPGGGTCQKECEPGDDSSCSPSQECNENGKCVAKNDIDVNLGGGGGMGGGENEDCIEVEVTFEPEIPNVVLLIDQSASMTGDDRIQEAIDSGAYVGWDCEPNENWRWNVVRNVLLNPETGIVKPLEDKVRFGLTTYSSEDGFGSSGDQTCPLLTEVDIAFDNHQAMLDAFQCNDLVNDTPTRESLTATAEKLAAADLDGPKVIVLATDGAPDTCECDDWGPGNGDVCDTDVEYMGMTYTAAQYEQILVALEAGRIHDELGITIEVINIGEANLKGHLDSVAAYGGAVSGESIDGTNPVALNDAFQSIIDGVRSCVIDLDGKITKGSEDTGTVTLDGEELEYNGDDGWVVLGPSQIELVGAACEKIKSGDHDIDVNFPCDSFEVITR